MSDVLVQPRDLLLMPEICQGRLERRRDFVVWRLWPRSLKKLLEVCRDLETDFVRFKQGVDGKFLLVGPHQGKLLQHCVTVADVLCNLPQVFKFVVHSIGGLVYSAGF